MSNPLREAAIFMISEVGKVLIDGANKNMADLFPNEPTELQPSDLDKCGVGDPAALVRILKGVLWKPASDLEKMSDEDLARALRASQVATLGVQKALESARISKCIENYRKNFANKGADARHAESREAAERITNFLISSVSAQSETKRLFL